MWEELCNPHGEDIDSLTDCITDYINFCVENTVPTRTVRCFPNNKPWINPDMKTLLKEKKRVFKSGNKEELKTVQRELRKKIRERKACYRRKMEDQLQQNNVSGVRKGLKTITGHKEPSSQAEEAQVRMELMKIKARKAADTDGISSRLLKTCADQLCGILLYMFDLSLRLGKVPQIWKASCVVPVPKMSHPKEFGDYQPVALTSHLMMTLERLVLTHFRPLKFSDDSAIVGLITDGKDIVRADSYKYLGDNLNNKLDWTDNTEAIYKKGQSRLFLLRRLRSFGVQGELLKTFFDSVVASAIFYGVVCWGSSISTADRKRLDKLIRKALPVCNIT
ncbi:hypothetical protein C0J45_23309 [Silurus meridionalis]|nr:hypothetical protein C0J45_23309 [Silurus meridionalis]